MSKILRGVLAALILTLLPSAPQPAAAATVDLGTLSPGNIIGIGIFLPPSGIPNEFYAGPPFSNQVLDNYLFKSTAAKVVATGSGEIEEEHRFFFLTAELIQGTDVNCTVCNVLATATGRTPSGPIFDLAFAGLTAGTQYFLRTLGTFNEFGVGFYTGSLAVSAAPLPPALWLFGTAIVGAVAFARRRAKREAKA